MESKSRTNLINYIEKKIEGHRVYQEYVSFFNDAFTEILFRRILFILFDVTVIWLCLIFILWILIKTFPLQGCADLCFLPYTMLCCPLDLSYLSYGFSAMIAIFFGSFLTTISTRKNKFQHSAIVGCLFLLIFGSLLVLAEYNLVHLLILIVGAFLSLFLGYRISFLL